MNAPHRWPSSPSYGMALRRLRGAIAGAFLFSAFINVLMLTGSIYMLQVYDRVLTSGSVPTLLGLFVVVVMLYAFLAFYDILRGRLLSRAALRLDLSLSARAFSDWISSPVASQPGSLRPLNDIATLRGFLSGPVASGLFDLPWVPLFLGILFLAHPWLGWITLAGAGISALLALVTQRISAGPIGRSARNDAEESEFVELGRGSAEAIRAMGMTGSVTAAWQRRHLASLSHQQAAGWAAEVLGPVSKAFRLLLQSTILTVGAYLVLKQQLSPGMIVASSIISGRALAPIDQVIGQWRGIGRAIQAHRRLAEVLPAAPVAPPQLELPAPTGHITLDKVTKLAPGRSPGERPRLVSQVSFELEPGDGLGVIGTSASGKTTLARLLVGAWTPDAGEIRLDGATPDQWSPEVLGRWIGYLPQQVRMLPGTIAENIARFDPEASDEAVIAAARLAGVHEMILAMPEGYSSLVGGASEVLSGGQIQRVALARAIYRMPRIVVLDEPNANLDAAGDDALARTVMALRKAGSVVVVMSHRPSGLAAVNKVLVLQAGRVQAFDLKEKVLRTLNQPPVAGVAGRPVPVGAAAQRRLPADAVARAPAPPQRVRLSPTDVPPGEAVAGHRLGRAGVQSTPPDAAAPTKGEVPLPPQAVSARGTEFAGPPAPHEAVPPPRQSGVAAKPASAREPAPDMIQPPRRPGVSAVADTRGAGAPAAKGDASPPPLRLQSDSRVTAQDGAKDMRRDEGTSQPAAANPSESQTKPSADASASQKPAGAHPPLHLTAAVAPAAEAAATQPAAPAADVPRHRPHRHESAAPPAEPLTGKQRRALRRLEAAAQRPLPEIRPPERGDSVWPPLPPLPRAFWATSGKPKAVESHPAPAKATGTDPVGRS